MENVPKPSADGDQHVRVAELRVRHHGWAFAWLPEVNMAWEAKRSLYRLPENGGVAWIRAASAARLTDLVAAAERIEVS